MACSEIESWTFSGLVGAFLDLAIVFLLLCASTLTYMVSKLFGLFGSSLPCHCNANFGDPRNEKCWQKVLVKCPSEKISSVQLSVRSKIPFDSILNQNMNPQSNSHLLNDNNEGDNYFDLKAEASSTSKDRSEMDIDAKEESFDVKGKEVSSQKRKHALRRRRKGSTDVRRLSSVSSYGSAQLDLEAATASPASVNKMESKEGETISDNFRHATLQYGRYSSMDLDLVSRESSGFKSDEPMDENKPTETDVLSADEWKFDALGKLSYGSDEKNAIRILEQALEDEHTARVALCDELEKERNAAASAADEAMAMILRLQKEKASVEMEARQYQRMIEEKAAYDFEEMNILKEILLRREREKHFLEKEVETYRQIIFGNKQMEADANDVGTSLTRRASLLLYSGQDPLLMLKSISKSFHESEMEHNENEISEYDPASVDLQDCEVTFGKELSIPEFDRVGSLKQEYSPTEITVKKCDKKFSAGNEEMNEDFEKMMLLPSDKSPCRFENELKDEEKELEYEFLDADGHILHEKTVVSVRDMQQQNDVVSKSQVTSSNSNQTCDNDLEEDANRMINMDLPKIDEQCNLDSKVGENERINLSENVPADIPRRRDDQIVSRSQNMQEISRSCSDITRGLPPLVRAQEMSSLSDFRRNSMSQVDYERFKIDNEIGWLRERLKIVQEGRVKLKMSIEHGEKDKVQLQLLENIVNQLQEIRQLTGTARTVRQVSLPPFNCKVMSKKRRWRSFSLEVHGRT